jgi:hypothetical protein
MTRRNDFVAQFLLLAKRKLQKKNDKTLWSMLAYTFDKITLIKSQENIRETEFLFGLYEKTYLI